MPLMTLDLQYCLIPSSDMTTFIKPPGVMSGVSQVGHWPRAHTFQRANLAEMTPDLSLLSLVVLAPNVPLKGAVGTQCRTLL